MRKYIKSIFSLDTKALSIFRILIAFLVILDVCIQLKSFGAFHSSQGVMPLDVLFDHHYEEAFWSIFTIISHSGITLLGIILQLLAGIGLLVGWKTQYMSIAVRVFVVSLQARNPMILNGGDTALKLLLFRSMFLPLNERYSWDKRGTPDQQRATHTLSLASAGFITQLVIVYVFSFLLKDHPSWTSQFDATYLALSLDAFRTSLGDILYQQYSLLEIMTKSVYLLEGRGWVFLIIPRKNKVFRTAIIGVYMMFHFGLGITMNLGLFPWIMITGWLALVPLQFLHKGHTDKIRNNGPSRNIQIFLGFVLVYILCRNIRTLDFNTHKQRFPYEINRIGFLLRIEQHRNMFAPFPTTEDGRFEIMGETDEGENVLLNNPTIGMHYGKNPGSHRQYVNEKRHKLYSNLRIASSSYMRKPYLQRVCTEYPDIKRIDMVFIKEQTLDNYQTGELERNHLSRIQCN